MEYNPSMRSKKIVYFNQNPVDPMNSRRDSTNKGLSINKGLRQSSTNKQHKIQHKHSPSVRLSTNYNEKGGNSQKIRVLLTRDGFIFEKKYMIYDIQCALIKTQKPNDNKVCLDSSTSSVSSVPSIQQQIIPPLNFQQPPSLSPLPISSLATTQQCQYNDDITYLNFQISSISITRNTVRHNFPIQRDNSNYIQVKTAGFQIQSLIIANKKIEFVAYQGYNQDEHQITIIQPIKLVQNAQNIREQKINQYYHKINSIKQGRYISKSLDFSWSLQPSTQNAQIPVFAKSHTKKNSEIQGITNNNNQIMANLFSQNGSQTQRQRQRERESSKSKRVSQNMSNASSISYTVNETKTVKQSSNIQRSGLVDFMRPTKQMLTPSNKQKITSRKFLNDSGLNYGVFNKMQNGNNNNNNNKENSKKQDAYGLEEAKKCRNRTQNQDSKKTTQLQIQHRKIEIQLNRYGLPSKHT